MKKLLIAMSMVLIAHVPNAISNECCEILTVDDNFFRQLEKSINSLQRPRFSDKSLKQNTAQVDKALEKVAKLKGVTLEWKSPSETDIELFPQGKDIGVIAQDVEKVFPELVHNVKVTDKNDAEVTLKEVNYAGLVSVLIEAMKELKKENEAFRLQLGL
ncbi:tail fiber domain-containing protein [Spartinivicinus poritis]|uniref:Tail fiber domain-containing protein n=1 Tax=Spartinivicinus poritis TaxID=2994640 RepID=A0ABT5UHC4_9GAMM|nr:tail fiber domain-containing protein [Spartinivicinus sp. A2-2]MDE1465770.1 tail fiber domain-containing protein [Spartinivicinus sp. A2-2]